MGFPSPACITCKKRRVKCDFVRPNCGRCHKANRCCLWEHAAQTTFVFKSENSFAKGQKRRSGRAQPESFQHVNLGPLAVLDITTIPVETYAFNHWIKNFTAWPLNVRDIEHEYGAYALHYWKDALPESTLRLSVSAFSLAFFGKIMRSEKALRDASAAYARSVQAMRREVAALSTGNIDQLVIATMILAYYDNIMFQDKRGLAHGRIGSRNTNSSLLTKSGSRAAPDLGHCKGTAGLLKARQGNGWKINPQLDGMARRPIVRSCLLNWTAVPGWLLEEELYSEDDPVLQLDLILVRVAAFQSKALGVFQQMRDLSEYQVDARSDIIIEAQRLDEALETWSTSLPDGWEFSVIPTCKGEESDIMFDGQTHHYSTHSHATVWNRYRAARLIVNRILMQALANHDSCSIDHLNHVHLCQAMIDTLVTDMCRSAAFFYSPQTNTAAASSTYEQPISPRMATLLVWPLTIAITTEYVSRAQKKWLREKIHTLAKATGVHMLMSISDSDVEE